jgi:predicted metal-binding membrane protein
MTNREERMKTIMRLMPGQSVVWLMFFASVLAAWSTLFALQAPDPGAVSWDTSGTAFLWSLCSGTVADAGYPTAFLMWSLMALAMMAPTAFPAFRTYQDLTHASAANALSLATLIAGYLAVWLGFSTIAAVLQVQLAAQGFVDAAGRSTSIALNGALLLVAGLYQFSTLKEACLSACQSPMTFFLGHWRPGVSGAFRLGLRLGAVCLGCCWALMLLAFVAGTMNLAFMGLAMVLMTLEKLPQIGTQLGAPLGVFLLLAGATVIALLFATSIQS